MVTNSQIKKIHTLKNILKLDNELYQEILSAYGAKSCKSLAPHLANEFIKQLEDMAVEAGLWVRPNKKFSELSNRAEMATPAQLRKIEAMWKEVAYVKDRDFIKKSLRLFLQKQFKISDLRFLEKSMVSKVIKSIESIKNK